MTRSKYSYEKHGGTSPADTTVVNARGGKQAHIATRLTLIPPGALMRVGEILSTGAEKYGIENWRLISYEEHLDHALEHAMRFLTHESGEDHLGNFCCRALMALEMNLCDNQRKELQNE